MIEKECVMSLGELPDRIVPGREIGKIIINLKQSESVDNKINDNY